MRGRLLQQIVGCFICLFCCGASTFAQPVDTLLPVNERGKWGFVTSKGILAFPFEYESALYWGAARFGKVKKNGQWNLLTRKGHLLKLPVEGIPEVFNDSILIIKTLDGEVLVSENGRRILPESYAKIRPLENGYFVYYRDDSCGLGHIAKGVITAPLYSNIQQKGNDGFVVSNCTKNGWLNAKGDEMLEPIYEFIQYGENGLLQIQLGEANLSGVYDYRQPKWLVECAWTELNDSNSHFLVMNDERGSFLYHRKTATWFPGAYQQIELRKDIVRILCDTGQGIISNENELLLPPIYSSIQKEHGAYIVQKDSIYKLFQLNGKALNDESYKNIQSLTTPAWVVERNSDWVVIDSTGKILLSNLHDPLVLGNKVKYYDGTSMLSFEVNEKGQITNRQSFDNVVKLKVNGYSESIAKPQTGLSGPGKTDALSRWFRDDKSQKWGLILANGKTAIPPTYDYISSDQYYGLTYVYIKKAQRDLDFMGEECVYTAKAGLVDDQTGKELIPPTYLDIFLTGGKETPLYFGITDDFRFQQIVPHSKEKMLSYAWVDKVTDIPVRALAGNGLDRKTNTSKERICSKYDMINRINNPTFNVMYKSRTPRSLQQGMTSSLKKWVYIFPNTVKPIGYFSEAEAFNYKTAIVRDFTSQLYGLLGKDGTYSVAKSFKNIERRKMNDKVVYLLTKADSSTCLFNTDNDIITMNKNVNVVNYDNHITYVDQELYAGFYDAYNRPVLFEDAEKTGELSEGFIAVCKKGKWTYYRENKKALNEASYTKAFEFHQGKALIKERGKWYFLMMDGIKSDALPWKQMKPLSNGNFLVYNGKKWLIADEEGNALMEENGFDKASILKDAPMIAVSNGNKWGLLTNEGQAASGVHFSHISYLGDDLYALYKGKRLYIKHGITKEKKVKHIDFFGKSAEGTLPIRKRKGWTLADTSLTTISPSRFTTLRTQHQGYSIASRNNQYCLIDSTGTIVFTTKNRLTGNFSDGYVLMYNSHTNAYSFVNSHGENRFGNSYEKAFPFENGKAWVKQNNSWGSIDNSGEWIDHPRYYDVKKLNASAYVAKAGALYGICNEEGKMILDPSFDRIEMRDKQFIGGAKGASMVWKHISGEEIFNRIDQATLANTP